MPYSGNPATSATDRVRLLVGDIWDDFEILQDADYQFWLDKYSGNENRSALDAARAILFKLSRLTRERTGDIEVYGSEWFKDYRAALQDMLKNPDLSINIAMPYAGGISKSDMRDNDSNSDNTVRDVFIGSTTNTKLYDQCNPSYLNPLVF